VRGLKLNNCASRRASFQVAPHAGAWIETLIEIGLKLSSDVAPHAGAWIETYYLTNIKHIDTSHPTRVRGLKQQEEFY